MRAAAIALCLALLGGCEAPEDADTNPIPYVEEAKAMCQPFGGIARLSVKHWKRARHLHIFVKCGDGTELTRRRAE